MITFTLIGIKDPNENQLWRLTLYNYFVQDVIDHVSRDTDPVNYGTENSFCSVLFFIIVQCLTIQIAIQILFLNQCDLISRLMAQNDKERRSKLFQFKGSQLKLRIHYLKIRHLD
uniref:Uncharacterized protein n=1 Tax=Glossina brevipalpis TaxID=37001 RepID=A0A1A9WXC4_9MUSC